MRCKEDAAAVICGIFLIILFTIYCIVKTMNDERVIDCYAPAPAYEYEPMEEELTDIERMILEDYHHITKEDALW